MLKYNGYSAIYDSRHGRKHYKDEGIIKKSGDII